MRGASGQEEVWAQARSSLQREQAEPPPEGHRNEPSCNADLPGGRSETEWEILKVGCRNLTSSDGEGISRDCWLEPNEGVAL